MQINDVWVLKLMLCSLKCFANFLADLECLIKLCRSGSFNNLSKKWLPFKKQQKLKVYIQQWIITVFGQKAAGDQKQQVKKLEANCLRHSFFENNKFETQTPVFYAQLTGCF